MRDPDRELLLSLLKKHGWNSTSFQTLEPDFQYWFDTSDACVAFVETRGARVVAGAPVADPAELEEVSRRFIANAKKEGRRVSFFAVEERLLDRLSLKAIPIGEQPYWNPQNWEAVTRGSRSLREQFRRAAAKGVTVEVAESHRAVGELRGEMESLIRRWIGSRSMPAMKFLVALEPFGFPNERRYYLARCRGRLVGALVAVPVYAQGGWFFEDLLRDPSAPNGTTEALVNAAMKDVAQLGSTWVTLGLVPLAGDAAWMQLARTVFAPFYNFEGLRFFKAKLKPDGWDPIYLAYPASETAAVALADVLSAFAAGRPYRFAADAILRGPAGVLALLSALLIPWTALLALADRERFPSPGLRRGWIVFDLLMAFGLWRVTRRRSRSRLTTLALAATADAVLTVSQAAVWNVPRASRKRDWAIIAVSVTAPILASAILWRARFFESSRKK